MKANTDFAVERAPGKGRAWLHYEAIIGYVGCFVLLMFGALLLIIEERTAGALPLLHTLGVVLAYSCLPLLILGAYCLDKTTDETYSVRRTRTLARFDSRRAPKKQTRQHKTSFVYGALGVVMLMFAVAAPTHAQQTIFNVPTTDVLDKGKVYAELDVPFKPNDDDSVRRFSSFVPRIVVGVGGRTEVGLNVTGNIQPGVDVTSLVPTVKFKLYDGGDNGYDLVVGDNLTIPVRNRDLVSYDVGNYAYLNGSKAIGKTRLTAGVYHFSRGVVAADAQRAGGQFGFEQTIKPRFTVAADWITGKHAASYFTPGVNFKPDKAGKITGYAAYSIGNTNVRGGNHFFLLEIGYNFN